MRGVLLEVVLVLSVAGAADGQCTPQWSAYSGPQLDNGVYCVTTWDPDGPGPAGRVVVAGGNFQNAGANPLRFVGAWNGAVWEGIGGGVSGTVLTALETTTPWGGSNRLAIGGVFSLGGASQLNRIAIFNGLVWLPMSSGVGPSSALPSVESTAAQDSWLIIGGAFTSAGSVNVPGLARWNGSSWSAFPDTSVGFPNDLLTTGATLYGAFLGSSGVRRWDSPSWVRMGAAPNDEVWSLTEFRGEVIAGGSFTNLGTRIARFNGTAWQPLGTGINGPVYALCVFDPDGPGPMPDLLIAAGSFSVAGNQAASNIAAWDGANWMPLGSGTTGEVESMTVWNNKLVVGGLFFSAGGLVSPGMAFWGCPEVPVCYANCDLSNASPALNINDFVCFINRFAAGESYANCDQSTAPPVLNVLDFSCFITKFAGGCT